MTFADRLIANFRTENAGPDRVTGMLFAHDASIPVVFERERLGELEMLPAEGEVVKLRVDCRPWISGSGQLSFIVQKFQVLDEPAAVDVDVEPRGEDSVVPGIGHGV